MPERGASSSSSKSVVVFVQISLLTTPLLRRERDENGCDAATRGGQGDSTAREAYCWLGVVNHETGVPRAMTPDTYLRGARWFILWIDPAKLTVQATRSWRTTGPISWQGATNTIAAQFFLPG